MLPSLCDLSLHFLVHVAHLGPGHAAAARFIYPSSPREYNETTPMSGTIWQSFKMTDVQKM